MGVATCFIFAYSWDDENVWSLRLNEKGHIDQPLELRLLEEVRSLQLNARTLVVLPSDLASLHQVEMPWINERKARSALLFSLEEQCAQSISTLHVAFDKAFYHQQRYLVVSIDKAYLTQLMERLTLHQIKFDAITIDWFALHANDVVLTDRYLLVNHSKHQGALSLELMPMFLANLPETDPMIQLNDHLDVEHLRALTPVNQRTKEWVASRLFSLPWVNLCQGELHHENAKPSFQRYYRFSAVFLGVWFIGLLGFKLLCLSWLHSKNNVLDEKISVIYRSFFPGSTSVISPQFRINQLLNSRFGELNPSFWTLLNAISKIHLQHPFGIDELRFQHQSMSMKINCDDFKTLELIESGLQSLHIHVRQVTATSHEHRVLSTLELSS